MVLFPDKLKLPRNSCKWCSSELLGVLLVERNFEHIFLWGYSDCSHALLSDEKTRHAQRGLTVFRPISPSHISMTPARGDKLKECSPCYEDLWILRCRWKMYAHVEIFTTRASRILLRPNASETANMYCVSIELQNRSTGIISRLWLAPLLTIYYAVYSE